MSKDKHEPADQPKKTVADKIEEAKAEAARKPDTENVTIQAQNVTFAPLATGPQFDPAKSRAKDDKRLPAQEHDYAVRVIMKQTGATQDQAEDALAELDQTQCNDLIDAANSNRIDHIHRVLGGMTLTSAENLPDSNDKEDVRLAAEAREAAAEAEGEAKKGLKQRLSDRSEAVKASHKEAKKRK